MWRLSDAELNCVRTKIRLISACRQPLTGTSLEQASTAALAHTGGGEVTEAEVGDDGAAYEVEVRLADGRSVEVQLDAQYQVTGEEADDDDGGAADEQDESESEEEGSD